jgi:uncharacterized membrane protein
MDVEPAVFRSILMLAAFLCSLVAGFLFAFAVVVMPGIGRLDDGAFIRGFQAIDGVIQKNQPLFLFVWVGSMPAVLTAAVLGGSALNGLDRVLILFAAAVYFLCVQLPTVAINIPLNGALQKVDVGALAGTERRRTRDQFEARWNRWNIFRTGSASVSSLALLWLLLRV